MLDRMAGERVPESEGPPDGERPTGDEKQSEHPEPAGDERAEPADGEPSGPRRRRRPTELEAKALAHPLRQQILRLCAHQELTNKQLADRLGGEPGTVLHHVRLLVAAGLLQPAEVRTGPSGALEKPYRSAGKTWWLDDPLAGAEPDVRFAPVESALADVLTGGPDAVATYATFLLHLSPDEVTELDRRVLAVLDEYIASDGERLDRPVHRGVFVVHRLADPSSGEPAEGRDERRPT